MRELLRTAICGIALGVMAGAAGIASFTAEWWAFMVAGSAFAAALRGAEKK